MPAASSQITDAATITQGVPHNIPVIVAAPGTVSIVSRPIGTLPTQSETGLLGRIQLLRPVRPATFAINKPFAIGSKEMTASYEATEADVALGGTWTCRISNETDDQREFDTTLTVPPIPTASFDVGLLNAMLELAARTAALHLHLHTTGDGSAASIASWSIPIAALLPATPVEVTKGEPKVVLKNATDVHFVLDTLDAFSIHVPVIGNVRLADGNIINADSLFGVGISVGSQNNIVASVAFDAPNMHLTVTPHIPDPLGGDVTLDVADVRLQVFQLEVSIDFDGRTTLDAQVSASATILGQVVDLSDKIRDRLLARVQERLGASLTDPATVKNGIFAFLTNLMRLNDIVLPNETTPFSATILDANVDGRTLTVSYVLTPASHQTT